MSRVPPSPPAPTPGRRERKKLATRRSIADHALALFLARGFDLVTIAEIAEAADVAVSTVFTHFASKEAIVFADDPATEAELVRAVRERAGGVSISQSLREHLIASPALVAGPAKLVKLVRGTPALTEYSDRLWSRHARAVASAIQTETGWDAADIRMRAWARFVVQIPSIVREEVDRPAAVTAVFELLDRGWTPDRPPPRATREQSATDGS